jgi:HprK-related kinase A
VILDELSSEDFHARLRNGGVRWQIGPFAVRVASRMTKLAAALRFLYGDFPLLAETEPAEFRITMKPPLGFRRWWRRQVIFQFDDRRPFEPFPFRLAFPFFEWGLNWCVYEHAHEFLIIHAAVVERGGRALLMPAVPGSGKSTLCAGLIHRGWRLLSDELALIRRSDGFVLPIPRPIGLKEESIDIIQAFAPGARLGPVFAETRKGTIAHLRPPTDAVTRMNEAALPAWIVFPTYEAGAALRLEPLEKATAFIRTSDDSFNYKLLGEAGFTALADLIDGCECFELTHSSLDAAIGAINAMTSAPAHEAR